MTKADWIAADWGTTNLRVWAMSNSGTVLDTASSADGMGNITRTDYAACLRKLVGDWITPQTPIVACGMVGSRQGWVEASYATVPCPALADNFARPDAPDLNVHVVPGIKQTDPADVMRGEETQIAGFLSLNPNWDGVICLPGTHTKWVHVSADEVVSFQTCMTGDLFAAISGHTVLKHSTGGDGWDADAFDAALGDTISRPEKLAAKLFALRAEGLLHGLSNDTARAINRALAARDAAIGVLIAETGGINAMVVDSSALPEQVTDAVVQSAFRSAGQRCSALRLLFSNV
jgi:2-dehydro-3-deoxygalactonokinase